MSVTRSGGRRIGEKEQDVPRFVDCRVPKNRSMFTSKC
jgi:hypothetical protein